LRSRRLPHSQQFPCRRFFLGDARRRHNVFERRRRRGSRSRRPVSAVRATRHIYRSSRRRSAPGGIVSLVRFSYSPVLIVQYVRRETMTRVFGRPPKSGRMADGRMSMGLFGDKSGRDAWDEVAEVSAGLLSGAGYRGAAVRASRRLWTAGHGRW
jgi:hypothetical protein